MSFPTTPPSSVITGRIQLPEYESHYFGNASLHMVGGALQDIIKIELTYPAGKWHEQQKGASLFLSEMLTEGTQGYTAEALALRLDYMGASLSAEAGSDFLTITAYCLTRHVPEMLDLLQEVVGAPLFPEEELQIKQSIHLQRHRINQEKVEYLATKGLMNGLFGADYPYGYRMSADDIKAITRQTLQQQYHQLIENRPFLAMVSGRIPDGFADLFLNKLGHLATLEPISSPLHPMTPPATGRQYIHKQGASQSALRVGRTMPHYTDPDFYSLKILNTILGGYFGSRLMSNIREDKGFTYGIYSVMHSYKERGAFYISTEVGKEYEQAALSEIYLELSRLVHEPVPAAELTLVRNYLLGNIMGGIDGPMKAAANIKALLLNGETVEDFDRFIDRIHSITPSDLQELAQRYLRPEAMLTVIAGEQEA